MVQESLCRLKDNFLIWKDWTEGGVMTPSEVKRYLAERKVAPLIDIAVHFDMEPDAVRGLLGHWIRKGRVRLHQDESCNSGGCCGDCGTHSKEVYEWLQ
jgi:hypothetical protein